MTRSPVDHLIRLDERLIALLSRLQAAGAERLGIGRRQFQFLLFSAIVLADFLVMLASLSVSEDSGPALPASFVLLCLVVGVPSILGDERDRSSRGLAAAARAARFIRSRSGLALRAASVLLVYLVAVLGAGLDVLDVRLVPLALLYVFLASLGVAPERSRGEGRRREPA